MNHPTARSEPTPGPRTLLWKAVALATALGLLGAGCGSTKAADPAPTTTAPVGSPPTVMGVTTMRIAQVNATVLVDDQREPLYMFLPDERSRVTCTGLCAASWPPVYQHKSKLKVAGAAQASLLGSDTDPTGGRVVTYDGWPLYTYADDTQPGYAAGQGVNLDGGYWYLMRPDGKPLVPNGLPQATKSTTR